MENGGILYIWSFGIIYGHLVYFMSIWLCCGYLVYFSPFWYIVSRQIWQPWCVPGLIERRYVRFHLVHKMRGGAGDRLARVNRRSC
jgi:hypothetical protein